MAPRAEHSKQNGTRKNVFVYLAQAQIEGTAIVLKQVEIFQVVAQLTFPSAQ